MFVETMYHQAGCKERVMDIQKAVEWYMSVYTKKNPVVQVMSLGEQVHVWLEEALTRLGWGRVLDVKIQHNECYISHSSRQVRDKLIMAK